MRSLSLVCLLGLLAACAPPSAHGDSALDDDGAGASQNQGGSNDGGSTSNQGGSPNGFGTGGDGGSTSNTMECASEAIEAELAPLTMFITFDKSGSMDDNGKWTNATTALKTFFGDPGAAELEVALRFFPEGQCNENSCDVGACATPNVNVGALTVDAAPTDAQEAALIAAIDSQDPNGATPISAALEGAIDWSTAYLQSNPMHKVVVILVTDGEPNGCDENIGAISNIAASGLLDEVVTYTVGLAGSNEGQLQNIATAGGGAAFFVGNGNTEDELLAALQAIRGEQLACEITIPEPTEGDFNPDLVNVTFTPGGGGAEQTFGKVNDEASCGSSGGWYYDDNANPTMIILCPSTCEAVQGDGDGKIEVVLGCETIPA
ncbi:MAG: VWA domain-containing protein [Polyangiaceae bacterium]|nr:VWA domain-containing protein [Polyangiaceae bacterium]